MKKYFLFIFIPFILAVGGPGVVEADTTITVIVNDEVVYTQVIEDADVVVVEKEISTKTETPINP